MPDVLRLLTYANRREVARALREKGYKVSGETLNRWVRDRREVPLEVRDAILRLYGLPVIQKEEPPPWWAGAEDRLVQEITKNRDEIKRLVDPMRGDVTALVRDMERGHAAGDEGSSPRPSGAVAPANKSTQDGRDATPPPTRSPQSRVRRKK